MRDIIGAPAGWLARAIRTKQVSSLEVVRAHLEHIHTVNPRLNAVVFATGESALKQARAADRKSSKRNPVLGPLHGVPFTAKDIFDTEGLPTTAGLRMLRSNIPDRDATVVARMRAAGAILIGTTLCPPGGVGGDSWNSLHGGTRNPYDISRSPGASSSGEAAIIAAGGSPLGLGSDSGGSIRMPAHYCGLAAIKPTSGRVPRTGQFPMPLGARNPVFHVSLIARKVQDLALALPIISGPDFRDHSIVGMPLGDPTKVVLRDLKVAYFDDDGVAAPTKEIVAAVRDSAKAFADAGVKVEESRPPDAAKPGAVYFDISRGDGGAGTRGFLKSIGSNEISPMFERALAVAVAPAMANTTEALSAFARWDLFRNSMLRTQGLRGVGH